MLRVLFPALSLMILAGCATGEVEMMAEPAPAAGPAGNPLHPALAPDGSPEAPFYPSRGLMGNPGAYTLGSGDQVVCYDTYDWRTGQSGMNCSELLR